MPSDADDTELFAREHGSIAPFAVDVHGRHRALAALEATHIIARSTPASHRASLLAAAGALAVLSLVSAFALRVPSSPARAAGQPRAPRVVAAHEAVMLPVRTAPAKDLIALDEDDATTISVSALPAYRAAPARRHGRGRPSPRARALD